MRRRTTRTRSHLDGDLANGESRTCGDDESLNSVAEVLGRILTGEEGDCSAASELEPGGGVREPCATDTGQDHREHDHGPVAWAAYLIGSLAGEARTDDEICVLALSSSQ